MTRSRWLLGFLVGVGVGGMTVGCSGSSPPPAGAVARFDGGYVTVPELERQLDSVPRKLPADQNPREWLARRIAWRKLLLEKWRGEIETSPGWRLAVHGAECRFLVDSLMGSLASAVEIPDEVVDAEVERQRRIAAGRSESLRVRHIYLRADSTMTASERAAQRALAEQLLARLRGGESFEQLARKFSESETARNGGLIDGLRRGVADEAFEEAAFALEKGEISDVVTTPRGYHIVRLEERFTPPPFVEAKVRSLILSQLRHEALQQQRAELISRLKGSSSYFAGWDESGQLHPDARGVVLEVGDFVVTTEDLGAMEPQASAFGRQDPSPAGRLEALLEGELLCREALSRDVVSGDTLAEERAAAVAELLQKSAELRELEQLREAVSDEDLSRFAAEFPRRVTVAGGLRVQVLIIGYAAPQAYDTYVRARDLAEKARSGVSLPDLARRSDAGSDVKLIEDSGLIPPERLSDFGPEVAQAVSRLSVGEVTEPIRLGSRGQRALAGDHEGAFVIVKLLEHAPERPLDPATEGAELRRRYWQRLGPEIVEQRVDQALVDAGFVLLEPR